MGGVHTRHALTAQWAEAMQSIAAGVSRCPEGAAGILHEVIRYEEVK